MAKIGLRNRKWSTRAPFLTPHLGSPKDIAAKSGDDLSGCHADRWHLRRDSVPGHKDRKNYSRFNTRQDVCICVCRI